MKVSREKQVARVEDFALLWDRLLNLYLNRDEFEDTSPAKESEFLALEGSVMQELAAVAELEEGRFALFEVVTSVINEAISLRHLKEQSEFQVRRRKERGRQVAELVENLRRFVAERDVAEKRREKDLEVRLARPFWDPEKGNFGTILSRLFASPSRFFSAIRVAGEARKANTFLLALMSLISAGCVIILTALNAPVVRAIAYTFARESGILTSQESAAANIILWLLVCVGVAIVGLAGTIAATVLAHLLAILMHIGFRATGAKGEVVGSHKVVAFGLAPLLLLLLVPVVAHFARSGESSSSLLVVLPVGMVCYIGVLHIIGFRKVHNAPVVAGIVGWLIGAFLFALIVLVSLWIWHASVGALPPSSGQYVYVTAKQTRMAKGSQPVRTLSKGEIVEFLEEKEKFLHVRRGKDDGWIKESDAQLREGSILSLPRFLLESSAARVEVLLDRLTRGIKK